MLCMARWLTFRADSDIPELHRLAHTIDSWRAELLTYFDSGGDSNGPTEATHLLIKKMKRSRHGFRNLDPVELEPTTYAVLMTRWREPGPFIYVASRTGRMRSLNLAV